MPKPKHGHHEPVGLDVDHGQQDTHARRDLVALGGLQAPLQVLGAPRLAHGARHVGHAPVGVGGLAQRRIVARRLHLAGGEQVVGDDRLPGLGGGRASEEPEARDPRVARLAVGRALAQPGARSVEPALVVPAGPSLYFRLPGRGLVLPGGHQLCRRQHDPCRQKEGHLVRVVGDPFGNGPAAEGVEQPVDDEPDRLASGKLGDGFLSQDA